MGLHGTSGYRPKSPVQIPCFRHGFPQVIPMESIASEISNEYMQTHERRHEMTSYWDERCQAEELAYFKGDMVLDSPECYTAEEMWDVVMEMLEATIAV